MAVSLFPIIHYTQTHTHDTAQKCRLHTVHSRKKEMRECQCVTLCGHHPMVGNIFYYVYIIQYWCERKALRNMNHSIHPHSRSERWNPYSYTYRERERKLINCNLYFGGNRIRLLSLHCKIEYISTFIGVHRNFDENLLPCMKWTGGSFWLSFVIAHHWMAKMRLTTMVQLTCNAKIASSWVF